VKTALVVEDDAPVLAYIAACLERKGGYTVSEAPDSEEALQLYEKGGPFDLVLINYLMPKQNGVQLAIAILKKNPSQRVVIQTGSLSEAEVSRPKELRYVPILFKPFRPTELFALLEKMDRGGVHRDDLQHTPRRKGGNRSRRTTCKDALVASVGHTLPERRDAPFRNDPYYDVLWALYLRERSLSRKDLLTGALNQLAFKEALEAEIKRSRRNLRPLTLCYVDLDNFKEVNDFLGHEAGNTVLQVAARTMQSNLREVDLVARLHGDEFALLLPETNADSVPTVLNKLQGALSGAMISKQWSVTFSIGAVTFNTPPYSVEAAVSEADRMMYLAKQAGKNRFKHIVINPDGDEDDIL
jgi:diguanylate cyclase (GGDEF)-like protein